MTVKAMLSKLSDVFKGADADEDDLVTAFHTKLGKAIEGYGDGAGLPADHPLHALKALHKEMGDVVMGCGTMAKSAEAPVEEPVEEKPAEEAQAESTESVEKSAKIVDLEKRLADKDAELAAERDKADLAGMVETLKCLKNVSINPETDAVIFKALRQREEPTFARVLEILKGADAVAEASAALTTAVGSDLPGDKASGNTAWVQIEQEATELVKANRKVSKAQAIDVVMKKRPDLVKKHYEEQGA